MWYGANMYTGHPRCTLSTGTQACGQAPSVNSPWILTNTIAYKAGSFWQNSILKPSKKSNRFLARWRRVWDLVCDVSAFGWRSSSLNARIKPLVPRVRQKKLTIKIFCVANGHFKNTLLLGHFTLALLYLKKHVKQCVSSWIWATNSEDLLIKNFPKLDIEILKWTQDKDNIAYDHYNLIWQSKNIIICKLCMQIILFDIFQLLQSYLLRFVSVDEWHALSQKNKGKNLQMHVKDLKW